MQEPVQGPMQGQGRPRLTRDSAHRMVGGVCAGIARYYGYDVTVVRVVAVLLALPGFGLVLYLALWVLMPADTAAPWAAATPATSVEEIAERTRHAAEELAAAARAAAEAARVAAEQLAEVARAATAAGREAWEQRGAPPAPPAAAAPVAPEAPEAPEVPSAPAAAAPPATPPTETRPA